MEMIGVSKWVFTVIASLHSGAGKVCCVHWRHFLTKGVSFVKAQPPTPCLPLLPCKSIPQLQKQGMLLQANEATAMGDVIRAFECYSPTIMLVRKWERR